MFHVETDFWRLVDVPNRALSGFGLFIINSDFSCLGIVLHIGFVKYIDRELELRTKWKLL